jgi:hypothetical protein
LATTAFTLSWTHSVEHTEWRETWRIADDRLQLVEASVEGPGAGIDVPDGARMTGTGWVYAPTLAPLPRLVLAASGMTPSGWRLCALGQCHDLGTTATAPITLWPAPECGAGPD